MVTILYIFINPYHNFGTSGAKMYSKGIQKNPKPTNQSKNV